MKRPPSGEQIELVSGDWQLTVVGVSGGMRTLRHREWDVLDGYPLDRMCDGAHGQPLIPWPNRIAAGQYTFDGKSYQLSLTEPLWANAIHGLTRWGHWHLVDRDAASVAVGYLLDPQPGYPFSLDIQLRYELGSDGLAVRTSVTNVGDARCPFGLGFHPYFTCGDENVDTSRLQLPASEYLPTDWRGIPNRPASAVEGTPLDFRDPRPIGTLALDHAFGDLRRDPDGLAWVGLRSADDRRQVAIWLDQSFRYVEIFTGDSLPRDQRRRGLGIEPMSCPPNAFVTGESLGVLEPGETRRSAWGVRVAET